MRKNERTERRTTSSRGGFKVGDMVKFHFVTRDVQGRIIEDRGAIGIGGRRLYRVQFDTDDVKTEIELPVTELQKVAA